MTICFFGNYNKKYPRCKILKRGLEQNNIKVIECHTSKNGLAKFLALFKTHQQIKKDYNVLLVMMGGYSLVWLAKIITRKPVYFDVFTSLYLTEVEDRKYINKKSLKAKYFAWLDKFCCQKADKVLLDTQAQIQYFVKKYNLEKDKFIKILVGADEEIYFPYKNFRKKDNKFIIHWHGYVVPFYGLEVVIEAAGLLNKHKDIEFQMISRFNSKFEKVKKLAVKKNLSNIKFYNEMTAEKLAEMINGAGLCLGIFGSNPKARLVVPNKIFEAVACQKAVITARHKVIQEVFEENKNIFLVKPNDAQELAYKILKIKNNKKLREGIAMNGYQLFKNKLKAEEVVKDLVEDLSSTL